MPRAEDMQTKQNVFAKEDIQAMENIVIVYVSAHFYVGSKQGVSAPLLTLT